jgi:superfamily II DNA or RNA helicase
MATKPNDRLLESKSLRQQEGAIKWRDAKGIGILYYYMGFGKTLTALNIVQRYITANQSAIVIILVPSEALSRQWKNNLNTFLTPAELLHVNLYSATEFINLDTKVQCDLLVVDEIHEFYTDEKVRLLDKTLIYYRFVLGLTGTPYDTQGRYKRVLDIIPIVDIITKEECLENGWISYYREFNVACQLNLTEKLLYANYSDQIKKLLPKFGHNGLDIAQKCLGGGDTTLSTGEIKHYTNFQWAAAVASKHGWRNDLDPSNPFHKEILTEWSPNLVIGYARNLMKAIKARKDIVYNSKSKVDAAIAFLLKHPHLRSIIFNQSTKVADKFHDAVPKCVVYHSQLPTIEMSFGRQGKIQKIGKARRKKLASELIMSGEAHHISTVSALDRGFNVTTFNCAITTAGTQNPTQYEQRNSRATRLNLDNPNEIVTIVNFYIKSTKEEPSVDEKWLKKRQRKVSHDIMWVESIDEINFDHDTSETVPQTPA